MFNVIPVALYSVISVLRLQRVNKELLNNLVQLVARISPFACSKFSVSQIYSGKSDDLSFLPWT